MHGHSIFKVMRLHNISEQYIIAAFSTTSGKDVAYTFNNMITVYMQEGKI